LIFCRLAARDRAGVSPTCHANTPSREIFRNRGLQTRFQAYRRRAARFTAGADSYGQRATFLRLINSSGAFMRDKDSFGGSLDYNRLRPNLWDPAYPGSADAKAHHHHQGGEGDGHRSALGQPGNGVSRGRQFRCLGDAHRAALHDLTAPDAERFELRDRKRSVTSP